MVWTTYQTRRYAEMGMQKVILIEVQKVYLNPLFVFWWYPSKFYKPVRRGSRRPQVLQLQLSHIITFNFLNYSNSIRRLT